ncbi:MAG: hypothetical protein PUC12_16990, partial [Clostridiales bacterium]|nr:hypothetical protein [Clostridiales bacterium]
MGDYKPPFTITNEILSYVSSISEKIGRITATGNLEARPHLRKNNRIKSIHSSLKIEANSLSLMEYDIPYTSKALMEKLGLKSKEGFRRNYLRPAVDMNLIRMTIPDKP